MTLHSHQVILSALLALATACWAHAQGTGEVYNGSFEKPTADGRRPDGWETAGERDILQQVAVEKDSQRGQVARLTCTKFVPGTSSSHAMMAQFGRVGVSSGQWYRVSLWARAADLEAGVAGMNLANFRTWGGPGLEVSFVPDDGWRKFEFHFRAGRDLQPADSRLAIYFTSTGTLWVDDVVIEKGAEPKLQWLPAIPLESVRNALPNSSFECGGEWWGCWWPGWVEGQSNLFQRIGERDQSQAFDGECSWRLTLSTDRPLRIYAGGVHTVTADSVQWGHPGWIRVEPGQPCVFSAYVKAREPRVMVGLSLKEPGDWRLGNSRSFMAADKWRRFEVAYTPKGDSLTAAVGFALPKETEGERTIWIDALQVERGNAASPYQPRTELEAAIETDAIGNVLTDPRKGLSFRIRAHNASKEPKTLQGRLRVTDFWDRTVWEEKPDLTVRPRQSAEKQYAVLADRQGFFRVRWEPEDGLAQNLRCAVMEPHTDDDSLFGFNHAFGRDFLLPLAHAGGLRWWRDWSNYWDTVQPKQGGQFDFSVPDMNVNRVLGLKGRMLLLLPAPSAAWSAAIPPELARHLEERRAKGLANDETTQLATAACKPKNLADFREYVRATVKHYQGRVAEYEILNEPLYTFYSLPNRPYNYQTSDYIEVLRTAYEAAKSVDAKCVVIGGIGCWPGMKWEDEFIEQGGLQWCDVSNYHMYPRRQRAEALEPLFQMRWEQMKKRGQAKPIWVTEFGLYAEDDLPFRPFHLGRPDDETMNGAMRPDEQTASADLVQLIAMMCAHGVRKVFFHCGSSPGLRDVSTYNIFFEYGGAPRKMYPAVAVLARMLGPDLQFVRKWAKPEGLHAYEFRSRGKTVVILWSRKANAPKLEAPEGLQAFDLMGNPLGKNQVLPSQAPLYFVGKRPQ